MQPDIRPPAGKRRLSVDGVYGKPGAQPAVRTASKAAPVTPPTRAVAPAPKPQAPRPQLGRHRPMSTLKLKSPQARTQPAAAPAQRSQQLGATAAAPSAPAPQQQPQARPTASEPIPEPAHSKWQSLQTAAIIGGGMIAGFGVQTLTFGLVAIAIYAVIALIFRIYSRTTFTLAFISLVAVPVILVARHNPEVAGNFATYTFLLIVIGIISLLRESPTSGRRYLHHKKRTS